MKRMLGLLLLGALVLGGRPAAAAHYQLTKVADGIYAAIAQPGGRVASNALVIVSSQQVTLAGAHFVLEGIKDLLAEVAKLTLLPVREVILTHHHRGFNFIDFDLPPTAELIMSWQTWQNLKSEFRQVKNPVAFFDTGLTLQRDPFTIVLTNTERGHTEGDAVVYLPNAGVLFASDLVFNDAFGYMGDGLMRDWVLTLKTLEGLDARVVVPGVGTITDSGGLQRFRVFMQDFLTEVLALVEKGDSLAQAKKKFSLPKYAKLPGYQTFLEINLERAYKELKEK